MVSPNFGSAAGGRCYEGIRKGSTRGATARAGLRVLHGSGRGTGLPKRDRQRSMRVNVVDSANAGADEGESKPPAFQIIVLVRKHKYSTIYISSTPDKCLGILPAISP